MTTPFAQSIAQYANLRAFARMHSRAWLIHDLFPKARFAPGDEQTRDTLFEVAWSFLSRPAIIVMSRIWSVNATRHRIGDLPAIVSNNFACWLNRGQLHRNTRDIKTNLVLPAGWAWYTFGWYVGGKHHRDDRDARTGLMLPASIYNEHEFEWFLNNDRHRDDTDPRTGLMLPALISDGHYQWFQNGCNLREDDPKILTCSGGWHV